MVGFGKSYSCISRARCAASNAPAVWYPGPPNGTVKRPEVAVRDPAKVEVISVERVHDE